MRALEPRVSAFVDHDGVRAHYEVYGEGEPTVFLLMPDTIVQSRAWKGQVPFLARSCQVVVIDPRGNGRSDVPRTPQQMSLQSMIDDAWAVLDTLDVERVVLAGLCTGAAQAVIMAAERPDRVLGLVAINPGMVLTPMMAHKAEFAARFDEVLDSDDGWAKLNRHYWLRDWPGFARFFFGEMFPEPHSSKQVEDCTAWATQPTAEIMLLDEDCDPDPRQMQDGARDVCRRVQCPVLVVSGSEDRCQHPDRGRIVAELTGGEYVLLEGAGHLPNARDPVKVNLLLRDFVRRVAPTGRALADA